MLYNLNVKNKNDDTRLFEKTQTFTKFSDLEKFLKTQIFNDSENEKYADVIKDGVIIMRITAVKSKNNSIRLHKEKIEEPVVLEFEECVIVPVSDE